VDLIQDFGESSICGAVQRKESLLCGWAWKENSYSSNWSNYSFCSIKSFPGYYLSLPNLSKNIVIM